MPALILTLALASWSLTPACTSTPQRIAFNVESAGAVTVDSAMTAWGDYVRQFHPPAAQEATVKALYEKYQAVMLEAIDASTLLAMTAKQPASTVADIAAVKARSDAASQAEANALSDLVGAIRTFGAKL